MSVMPRGSHPMAVIAIVNRKGGSGKSTLATHLASWCSHAGLPVMLGDMDRQQSTPAWLRARAKRRDLGGAAIVGAAVDPRSVLRPPSGVEHVVLDTPGGLRGFDLARVSVYADAILMPVCHSAFDRESTAACLAELRTLPRVASSQCKVAAVGMRIDGRTKAADALADWAAGLELPFLGVLREAQIYVRCAEKGLAIFDVLESQTAVDRAQWAPILDWVEPVLRSPRRAPASTESRAARAEALTTVARVSRPAPLAVTPRSAPAPTVRPMVASAPVSRPTTMIAPIDGLARNAGLAASGLFGWLPLPRFLQRNA